MNWKDAKISHYWHEIMDDISWYAPDEEAYILARLIAKMATELTALIKKDEEE